MKTICIMCPIGCELEITGSGDNVTVTGNRCPAGETYGKMEYTNPQRMVTSMIKINGKTASVKTSGMVSKSKVYEILKKIKNISVQIANVGDVLIENVDGNGVNIVVTGIFTD